MNRPVRRAARIQPSSRGRSAATPPLGEEKTRRIVVRQRPSLTGRACEPAGVSSAMSCIRIGVRSFSAGAVFPVPERPIHWIVLALVLLASPS